MTPRWLRLILVAALLGVTEIPLALIQAGAWTAMAWRAARRGSVASALAQTFDGRHPCAVCLAIRNAAPAPSLRAASIPKLDLAHQPCTVARVAVAAFSVPSFSPTRAVTALSPPLVPPPEPSLS